MERFWLILVGIVGGILGGMGMGGGTLLIPLLTIFLDIEQSVAQGINLLAFLPMSAVSLFIHFKNKMINYKISWPIVLTGTIGAVLGAMFVKFVEVNTLKIGFGIFLIVLGVFQFISVFFTKTKNNFQNDKK